MRPSGVPWKLFDIGVNLTSEMYEGRYHHGDTDAPPTHPEDTDLVVARAAKVGVAGMLITGTDLAESRKAVTLAKKFSSPTMACLATVGCHPTRCGEFEGHGPEAYLDGLRSLVAEHKRTANGAGVVAAIGECGLDYDRLHFCPVDIQKKYFEAQFQLAEESGLPMFLHNRNTSGDFCRLVRANRDRFSRGVAHSVTCSADELSELLDLGLFVGVNGCSLKTEENIAAACSIPLNRLLIETDAPWCEIRPSHAARSRLQDKGSISQALLREFPVVRKEKFQRNAMVKSRNEPCTLVEVLEVLYTARKEEMQASGMTLNDFAELLRRNTSAFLGFDFVGDTAAEAMAEVVVAR